MLIENQIAQNTSSSAILRTVLSLIACITQQFFAVISSLSLISSKTSDLSIKNNSSIHRHHHHHHLSH